ncbi:MAG TPA: S9 family peptidase [Steroidobacteraceae bacterium]|nr:S9 family peptidase [Steroidobacteraceae bacterium]
MKLRELLLGALIAAACGLAHPAIARATPAHPFGVDDLASLRNASAIAIDPAGKHVLYDVAYFGATGPEKHQVHEIGIAGDGDRVLSLPEKFTPAGFMADGTTLYGGYEVEGNQQLALVTLDDTEPMRLFVFPAGMHDPVISPDGKHFALLSDPRPRDAMEHVREVVENDESRLFVLDADGTQGGWWCTDLNYVGQVAWSPDGRRLAVVSEMPKIGHHEVQDSIDICDASGTKHVAELPAPISGIAWTDRGRTLAFISTTTQVLTPDHVWTVPVRGGTPRDRTPRLDGSAMSLVGDPHGSVWVELHKGISIEVDRFQDGQLTTAYTWPNGFVTQPVFPMLASSPQALAFRVGDPTHTGNVAVGHDGQLERITRESDELISRLSLGEVRVVNWTSKDGTHLQGILTFPADYKPGTPGRFLVLPHGGPEGNDILGFDWFARFVAGLGYVVMQPEYRGSTGYGSAFMDAIYQHFGDRAYQDVDSATDYAVSQGWADPNRLAMFGWSAGGFMTAWTVTQTHRYRAAIEGAGITDWLSFIPESDIAQVDYDARYEQRGAEPFLKFSPVMYADRVTTPLLILDGQADLRVPMLQGREFFILLAERHETVRMVTYPGSPHFPSLIEQRRNVFQEVADWLAKYNKG